MTSNSLLAFSAAFFSGALALVAVFLGQRSVAGWSFFAGMALISVENVLGGMSMETLTPEKVANWQTLLLVAKSFLPGTWLAFSLTYSRGNYREFLTKWRFALAAAFVLPVALSIGFRNELLSVVGDVAQGWGLRFGLAAKGLNILLLIATVFIVMNLEGTFRSAVGAMRWRIKFPVLGLVVIFGARIYTRSQSLLFSGHQLTLTSIEAAAVILGCTLLAIGFMRAGFSEIDVYPSQEVLRGSVTVLLAGGYLFAVGVLAQIIVFLGSVDDFQTKALLVLLGFAVLAVLLLSDRLRQRIERWVSHHLRRPQYDSRKIWTRFTHAMSSVTDQSGLCTVAAKSISETFDVLSVTVWLIDEQKDGLILEASTSQLQREATASNARLASTGSILSGLRKHAGPFDLETIGEDWGDALREIIRVQFLTGGCRIGVPLVAGNRCLGFAMLADRVNGLPYSMEEMDLLKCIGNQIAAGLLNLRLTGELMVGKELEAFQTMSAFFVHDLKNATASLSLMLQNLPVHFNDPAFREDALRGIAGTVNRINHLIERLSVLRRKLELSSVESDLNQLVTDALNDLQGMPGVEFVQELHPLPMLLADRELLQSVVTNLLLNAGDAVGTAGRVTVETGQRDSLAILSVSDNGCGMSAKFLKDSLFRPFQTTKKKGLGIGMFQSKMIVEAHRGSIQVESESGKGTTFRVLLPLQPEAP